MKDRKRYSEAFKLKVMEELRDGKFRKAEGPSGSSECKSAPEGCECCCRGKYK